MYLSESRQVKQLRFPVFCPFLSIIDAENWTPTHCEGIGLFGDFIVGNQIRPSKQRFMWIADTRAMPVEHSGSCNRS